MKKKKSKKIEEFQAKIKKLDQECKLKIEKLDQEYFARILKIDKKFELISEKLNQEYETRIRRLRENESELISEKLNQEFEARILETDQGFKTELEKLNQEFEARILETDQGFKTELEKLNQEFEARILEIDGNFEVNLSFIGHLVAVPVEKLLSRYDPKVTIKIGEVHLRKFSIGDLRIREGNFYFPRIFGKLDLEKYEKLVTLQLACCDFSKGVILPTNLVNVQLSFSAIESDLIIFKPLVNLEILDIGESVADDDEHRIKNMYFFPYAHRRINQFYGSLEALKNCKNLKFLCIGSQGDINAGLESLLENNKKLEHFGCNGTIFLKKIIVDLDIEIIAKDKEGEPHVFNHEEIQSYRAFLQQQDKYNCLTEEDYGKIFDAKIEAWKRELNKKHQTKETKTKIRELSKEELEKQDLELERRIQALKTGVVFSEPELSTQSDFSQTLTSANRWALGTSLIIPLAGLAYKTSSFWWPHLSAVGTWTWPLILSGLKIGLTIILPYLVAVAAVIICVWLVWKLGYYLITKPLADFAQAQVDKLFQFGQTIDQNISQFSQTISSQPGVQKNLRWLIWFLILLAFWTLLTKLVKWLINLWNKKKSNQKKNPKNSHYHTPKPKPLSIKTN